MLFAYKILFINLFNAVDQIILPQINKSRGQKEYHCTPTTRKFKFSSVNETDLLKVVNSFKNKLSSGYYDTSVNTVKLFYLQ